MEQGCDWLLPHQGEPTLSDSPLAESLSTLSRFFVGDGTLEETLQRVTDLTVDAVDGADMAGITMIVEGRQRTAVFTDDLAPELDQTQYDTGEVPCLAAFQTGEIHAIDDTFEEGRWPEFRRTAAEHGIHSILSLPMVVNKTGLGAMNLYSRRERAFPAADHEVGALFASQAAIVLANSQAYWDAREMSVRLGAAMEHRSVIEQAKGMLMATQRCGEDEAFQLLITASQRENVKLRDIARRIVDDATLRNRPPSVEP